MQLMPESKLCFAIFALQKLSFIKLAINFFGPRLELQAN